MGDFAPPASQLGQPLLGDLNVTPQPTAGQGLALDAKGKIPSSLLPTPAAAVKIVAGGVTSTGTVAFGSGFSASRSGVGTYTVTFTAAFASAPGVTISHGVGSITVVSDSIITAVSTSAFSVSIRDGSNTVQDNPFTFIAAASAN